MFTLGSLIGVHTVLPGSPVIILKEKYHKVTYLRKIESLSNLVYTFIRVVLFTLLG